MVATLGFLGGLEESHLLDMCTYNIGLSGSTWAINSWMHSELSKVKDYKKELFASSRFLNKHVAGVGASGWEKAYLAVYRNQYFYENSPLSIISIWGSLIAQHILVRTIDPAAILLSNIPDSLSKAQVPFPIFTSVTEIPGQARAKYQWIEFSPITLI